MPTTEERIREALGKNRRNTRMSANRKEKLDEQLARRYHNAETRDEKNAVVMMEDLADMERVYSSKLREAVPYERQREMGVSRPKQPKGVYVDEEEAWRRRKERRIPRSANYGSGED